MNSPSLKLLQNARRSDANERQNTTTTASVSGSAPGDSLIRPLEPLPPRPSSQEASDELNSSTSDGGSPPPPDPVSEGFQLLARSKEYRRLLLFPASCYEGEIREYQSAGRAKEASVQMDESKILDNVVQEVFARTPEMLAGCKLSLDEWATANLWAIPLLQPNSQERPVTLVFCRLPEGEEPTDRGEWKLRCPVTGAKGSKIPVRIDYCPFPVESDLWAEIGLGALMARRVFWADPVPED